MDFAAILKGALEGLAMSLGMQLLGCYMAGFFSGISKEKFLTVFIANGLASITMVCGSLMYEFRVSAPAG